jgi:hypothetical protein
MATKTLLDKNPDPDENETVKMDFLKSGDEEEINRLFVWVNKPCKVGEEKRGKSPWKRMLKEVPEQLSTTDRGTWEFRIGDNYLRASPNASYGYLYIALFATDGTQANNIEL